MVMPHIGTPELIIILVVVFVFFGVGKLPQVGNAIGKGMRAFRRGQQGEDETEATEDIPKKKVTRKAAATKQK